MSACIACPAAALDDPAFFDGMPPDWSPADILAQNTYQHYAKHMEDFIKENR